MAVVFPDPGAPTRTSAPPVDSSCCSSRSTIASSPRAAELALSRALGEIDGGALEPRGRNAALLLGRSLFLLTFAHDRGGQLLGAEMAAGEGGERSRLELERQCVQLLGLLDPARQERVRLQPR